MKVLLHFPSLASAPDGVWWVSTDDGNVENFYVPGSPLAVHGQMTMSRMHPTAHPDDIFEHLENRSPRPDVWTTMDVAEGKSPQQALDALRASISKEIKDVAKRKAKRYG